MQSWQLPLFESINNSFVAVRKFGCGYLCKHTELFDDGDFLWVNNCGKKEHDSKHTDVEQCT